MADRQGMADMVITTTSSPMRLWQIISAALPVGAFHYSQGLEKAVEHGWVHDPDSAQEWILAGLHYSLVYVDLPVLSRIWQAWQNAEHEEVVRWNAYLRACRETAELRAEDHDMGIALMALADAWDEPRPQTALGYTALFAVLAANNHIGLRDTLAGYSWAWCENLSLVATKLVPLGHLSGQHMLRQIGEQIEAATQQALAVADQDIGAGLPGMLLASAQHEQQYSRVFRS